jgi:hypothetical protein
MFSHGPPSSLRALDCAATCNFIEKTWINLSEKATPHRIFTPFYATCVEQEHEGVIITAGDVGGPRMTSQRSLANS